MDRHKKIKRDLDELRNDGVDIPDSAYTETFALLRWLPHNSKLPSIMTLDAGGIGLQWNIEDRIITMSLYGDYKVNVVVIFDNQDELSARCRLDSRILMSLFIYIMTF